MYRPFRVHILQCCDATVPFATVAVQMEQIRSEVESRLLLVDVVILLVPY